MILQSNYQSGHLTWLQTLVLRIMIIMKANDMSSFMNQNMQGTVGNENNATTECTLPLFIKT